MRQPTLWLMVIVLALFPAVAYADAGTPLLWAGAFHLLIGNAIIGIAEGMLLLLLFRPKRSGCVPIMIAANYFSAWVGGVFLTSTIVGELNLDLYSAWRWLWYMVAITYCLTLVLEWPFVALCFRTTDGWFCKSIWGSLIVQSASYAILFGWYWMASGTSLLTDLAVVQPSEISLPKSAMLYYIAENHGDVYATTLDHENTRKICALTALENSDVLFLCESHTAPGRWDLIVGVQPGMAPPAPQPTDRVVSAGLTRTVANPPLPGFWPGGEVPRFQDVDKSGWQF